MNCRARKRRRPLSRRGPRPLLLHLSLAWLRSSSLTAASLNWSSVWPNSWPRDPAGADQLPDPAQLQTSV